MGVQLPPLAPEPWESPGAGHESRRRGDRRAASAACRSRRPRRSCQKAWEQAFNRVQTRGASCPASARARCRASMIKLHFADDVRQEVARHLIPDVYRQALAETQLKPVEEPDLQGGDARGGRAAQVRGGGRDQARHHARRTTPASRSSTRPSPSPRPRWTRRSSTLREQHAEFRAVERAGRPRRPRDRGLHAHPRGHGARAPRPATASSSARAQRAARDRGGGDRARPRAARARRGCASPTTTATRRCAASRRRGQREGHRGQGEGAARARRRVRQDGGRSSRRWTRSGPRSARGSQARRERGEPPRARGRGASTRCWPATPSRCRRRSSCARSATRSSTPASACAARAWTRTSCRGTTRSCSRSCGPGAEKAVKRGPRSSRPSPRRKASRPTDADVDAEVERIAQASQRPAPAVRRMHASRAATWRGSGTPCASAGPSTSSSQRIRRRRA